MALDSILHLIDEEIAHLTQARALLNGHSTAHALSSTTRKPVKKTPGTVSAKRVLSDSARARIADAQKRRWAASRPAKPTPKVTIVAPKKAQAARIVKPRKSALHITKPAIQSAVPENVAVKSGSAPN